MIGIHGATCIFPGRAGVLAKTRAARAGLPDVVAYRRVEHPVLTFIRRVVFRGAAVVSALEVHLEVESGGQLVGQRYFKSKQVFLDPVEPGLVGHALFQTGAAVQVDAKILASQEMTTGAAGSVATVLGNRVGP